MGWHTTLICDTAATAQDRCLEAMVGVYEDMLMVMVSSSTIPCHLKVDLLPFSPTLLDLHTLHDQSVGRNAIAAVVCVNLIHAPYTAPIFPTPFVLHYVVALLERPFKI